MSVASTDFDTVESDDAELNIDIDDDTDEPEGYDIADSCWTCWCHGC